MQTVNRDTENSAAWIALQNPKSPQNVGNVMRASEFATDTKDNHEGSATRPWFLNMGQPCSLDEIKGDKTQL